MEHSTIESALETLRPSLAADGFTLSLLSADSSGVVEVALTAKPEACLDCLVPDDLMVGILENAIRKVEPTLDHVELVKVGFEDLPAH